MASVLGKHHILEAIDKLRSRKSRPDVLRIVQYVSKKYEFPRNDIKDYLEKLCQDGTVLKVEFKGSISYRNAANYRNNIPRTVPAEHEKSSINYEAVGELIVGAVAQLIVEQPERLDEGISMNELYKHLDDRYKKDLTKSNFKEILQKEVKNGNLVRFENGNYCLGFSNGDQNSFSPSGSDTSQSSVDKSKENSRSPINNIRRFANLSRHSSPTSSKNSSTSSLILSDKPMKPAATRVYTKLQKKEPVEKAKEVKAKEVKDVSKVKEAKEVKESKETKAKEGKEMKETTEAKESIDKNELSPVRESSRRKRFQKIVFDPSDSPKPKKLKEKESPLLLVAKKPKTPYKKTTKESEAIASEKSSRRESLLKQPLKMTALIKEELNIKEEVISGEESEEDSNIACCKICQFNIDLKSSRTSERYTSCHVCDKKAHVTCIEDTEHWTRFKLSKWQCNDCKSCVACKEGKDSKDVGLILCGLCDDAYHIKCANIKKSKVTQKWFCSKCSETFNEGVKAEKDEFESAEPTSNESSQRTSPEPEDKKEADIIVKSRKSSSHDDDEIDETIPDCSNWSCEEVYSYFVKFVLPEEADVFRDQEIDGRVLLLLTRNDVLCDFKLKLGPALKIYAQVKKLQIRKNDPCLFWP